MSKSDGHRPRLMNHLLVSATGLAELGRVPWILGAAASNMADSLWRLNAAPHVSVYEIAMSLQLVSSEKMPTSQKNIHPNWQPC